MSVLALRRLLWTRQLRNPIGLLMTLAVPVVAIALWATGERKLDRWLDVLLLGWLLVGLVPAALNGRPDRTVEARWRSLPVSTGERWFGAFLAFFPVPMVAGELLTMGALLLRPAT